MSRAKRAVTWTRDAVGSAWRDFLSIYYANTPTWRLFKSGGLAFFGFFCWAASNLLLSLRPGWSFLYYVMAYGFLLIPYGPFTHIVVVPLAIRWRKRASGTVNTLGKKMSKINISVFIVAVLVLGTMAPGIMILDFSSVTPGDSTDVDPTFDCERSEGEVSCVLSDEAGIDRVVVMSAGEEVTTLTEPPWNFTVPEDDLVQVRDSLRLEVEVQDEDGDTLRTFRERFYLE